MNEPIIIDHLFRHQYGKMVSVLTRVFGLSNLEMVEDAVQDTFVKALHAWKINPPENPEAWLMQAAKNRLVDLFRKVKADQKRTDVTPFLQNGPSTMAINELFLDDEIADSQLRMIFAACHPALKAPDQLAFALKTISGFSSKEIAAALLLKEETIKKRLSRARKFIQHESIAFTIPQGADLPLRLDRVHHVLYLIFNEGIHSIQQEKLIREELCGEALRLCKMLLKNQFTQTGTSYALFALMCFHAARLPSKVNEQDEIIDLRKQDRSKWYRPLILLGDTAMEKAVALVESEESAAFTVYHYEAAIVAEHIKAPSFEQTDWNKILMWYNRLLELIDSPITLLNVAIVHLQLQEYPEALSILEKISATDLEQREYLYHGTYAEYYIALGDTISAGVHLNKALALVKNEAERTYLQKKLAALASE